jgi:hypothetical protein
VRILGCLADYLVVLVDPPNSRGVRFDPLHGMHPPAPARPPCEGTAAPETPGADPQARTGSHLLLCPIRTAGLCACSRRSAAPSQARRGKGT